MIIRPFFIPGIAATEDFTVSCHRR